MFTRMNEDGGMDGLLEGGCGTKLSAVGFGLWVSVGENAGGFKVLIDPNELSKC